MNIIDLISDIIVRAILGLILGALAAFPTLWFWNEFLVNATTIAKPINYQLAYEFCFTAIILFSKFEYKKG